MGSLRLGEDAGIITRCYNLPVTELPLDGNVKEDVFKVHMRDCGRFVSMLEDYIKRNCYMVDQADYLAAVYDDARNLRSGTMQCVRYAREKQVPVILIHPDTAEGTW